MDQEITNYDPGWPPLTEGPNEVGPTDQAGEYRAVKQVLPAEPSARVPGEVRPTEQPIDVASQSQIPPRIRADLLSPAERGLDDPRHVARGKPNMSSS